MLAATIEGSKAKIIQFPNNKLKEETRVGKSTKMWCLKNREEIMKVYITFKNKIDNATSIRNKTKSTEQPIYKGFLVLFCCSAYQKRTSFIVISPIFLQLPLVCWGTNARICSGLLLRFRVPVCQLSTLEKSLN